MMQTQEMAAGAAGRRGRKHAVPVCGAQVQKLEPAPCSAGCTRRGPSTPTTATWGGTTVTSSNSSETLTDQTVVNGLNALSTKIYTLGLYELRLEDYAGYLHSAVAGSPSYYAPLFRARLDYLGRTAVRYGSQAGQLYDTEQSLLAIANTSDPAVSAAASKFESSYLTFRTIESQTWTQFVSIRQSLPPRF